MSEARLSRNDPRRNHDYGRLGREWTNARVTYNDNLSPEDLLPKKIHLLPTTAESFYAGIDKFEGIGWTDAIKTILCGTREERTTSPRSPLHLLRNHESTLIRHIFMFLAHEHARHVRLTIPAKYVGNLCGSEIGVFHEGRAYPNWMKRERNPDLALTSSGPTSGFVSYSVCGQVFNFPNPEDRDVNMMPFVLGNKESLPQDLQCYYELIEKCPYVREEIGRVAYLTAHESYVEAGKTQRRSGLHIESPGVFSDGNEASFAPAVEHPWGMGMFYGADLYEGGIYFASSVSDTSVLYDALVDNTIPGIVDKHGGCEHLRSLLREQKGTPLRSGELVWMTDCTPHEALPQKESGYRIFFRVVMPYVRHWYADHSTPNPKVPLPDTVTVVHGNKFAT